jgi:hypothetical protein
VIDGKSVKTTFASVLLSKGVPTKGLGMLKEEFKRETLHF